MTLAWIFLIAVLVGEVVTAVRSWWRLRAVRAWHQKAAQSPCAVDVLQPHVLFVIPALREQDALAATLSYFTSLEMDPSRTAICVVTTERERAERAAVERHVGALAADLDSGAPLSFLASEYGGLMPVSVLKRLHAEAEHLPRGSELEQYLLSLMRELPDTPALAQDLAAQWNRDLGRRLVWHLHYPRTDGMFAHQVNFAAGHLEEILGSQVDLSTCYIVPYCVDSRPARETLRVLAAHVANQGHSEVLQQYTTYTANWQENSWLMRAAALFQSNVDLRVGLANAALPTGLSVPVVASHGLMIRADIYRTLGGLSEKFWGEDMHFGCMAAVSGVPLGTLSCLGRGDSPAHLRVLVSQGAVWFRTGTVEFGPIWRSVTGRWGPPPLRGLVWALQRLQMNGAWLLSPILVVGSWLCPVWMGRPELTFVALSLFGLMIWTIQASTLETLRHVDPDAPVVTGWRLLPAMMAYFLLSNLGPVYALWLRLRERCWGIPATKQKTVR